MKKKRLQLVSPILLAGVLVILLPIFTLMTLDRLERQKEFFTQRLFEKGVSLIRTFEAGTRTGMFTMRWGAKRIQTMLSETALQPEVVYMMIASKEGRILAHSDASLVGQMYNSMPDIIKTKKDSNLVEYRIQKYNEGVEIFEIYKRFIPARAKFMRRHMRRHQMGPYPLESAPGQKNVQQNSQQKTKDWISLYIQNQTDKLPEMAEHYILAGLSMEKVRHARKRLVKETIWRGVSFFILGCIGMVALFMFQAYRSARASLTSVKAFSDTIIENMPSGLLTIDTQYRVTSLNQAAKEMFHKDISTPFPEIIELIKQMETSLDVLNTEISVTVAPEHNIRIYITASPIKDNENKVIGFLFLFRDLTQIRELKKQVETNKRLAAIGKLAAGVAHEIRNPLSSIKGFATYFGKRYEDNEADKETAQIMVKEVERINRSITALLEFAKPMTVEKKQVDIEDIITHSLKLVHQDLNKKKIRVMVDIDTTNKLISSDGDRINQVLLNLYINAIEALENEGTLQINVRDSENSEQIEIRVKDNGIGIDQDMLDQIFDPYFTTRSTGTGLGLSIVHRIIENLEGHIHVESTKGEGTCFIISLPV
ncbi:MAG: PAS domain-containing protein [Desulfobacteraceae bacterium]|nr:PAS domain-containing protein [Desulfobacteraceae bacterium]